MSTAHVKFPPRDVAETSICSPWHGVRQKRNGWADGPEYVTQCPIQPGGSYTYRFIIVGQEGTLWWHAHTSWVRATVHGALIIHPKIYSSYPFRKPDVEFPVILGEWWNKNPIEVLRQALKTGGAPNASDAFTINGRPGDLYNCSGEEITVFPVATGDIVLLRFINAAMNTELFVSVADHPMTVVAVDASYTKPFTTSVILLGPGQTTDVLIHATHHSGRFYIAAHAFASSPAAPLDNTTTTAILEYNTGETTTNPPALPRLPAFNDSAAADAFAAGLKSPRPVKIPAPVDNRLFTTVGLGLFNCPPGKQCGGPNGTRFGASMNNISFVLPRGKLSLLQAAVFGVSGVFTADFPASPPVKFDYTGNNISRSLWQPMKATKLYPVKFGSVMEVVLQGTSIVGVDEHPTHLHGYNFYVLARGKGNFDRRRDEGKFNLVDPPKRNTIGVPAGGWAVIRFVADNPGVWLMHCHIDSHLTWGLATALLVENGVGERESTLPPPPDLPAC
ncbi:Laccase-3 [Apostasia shenzhenica]|uniref:Laccase n=1 Tax=Apostasia shenzhenica TaxID=1088818 RepID=A0A2I0BGI2_9ASPA|nr:Laccase-3 [Apostasia shenzhenica]